MRISDWSSDVCSSDLGHQRRGGVAGERHELARLVVAGRHVDHRADERHRILGKIAVESATGVEEGALLKDMPGVIARHTGRSEEHTSELQSLMRISNAVFRFKKKKNDTKKHISCQHKIIRK